MIIGSSAIKHWYPEFPREPKDIDVVIEGDTLRSYEHGQGVEFLVNPVILERYAHRFTYTNYLEPDDILTLKASHLVYDINWEKHMYDVQWLLKKGHKVNHLLFWKLYLYWETVHGKNKRSDLKMSKEDFFDNNVNYNESEHDITHTYLNPVPIYTKVLKDGCEVELDEHKFMELSSEDALNFIREEVMVMAYERYRNLDYRMAYSRMLKKFIISHVPKFALVYTIVNYTKVCKAPFNYFKTIEDAIRIKGS